MRKRGQADALSQRAVGVPALSMDHRCQVVWVPGARRMIGALKGYFKSVEFVEGSVWTTDALFRETTDVSDIG